MKFIKVKNWERFQHYKDRSPPWVKLYNDMLSSHTWVSSNDASRALMVASMLLASRTNNQIPADPKYWQRVAYLNSPPDFSELVASDFIEIIDENGAASNVLANVYQDARPEKRREEKKREEERPTPSASRWDKAVKSLTPVMQEVQARKLIGSFCKTHLEDDVLDAILEAEGKADPAAYARAILKFKPRKVADPFAGAI